MSAEFLVFRDIILEQLNLDILFDYYANVTREDFRSTTRRDMAPIYILLSLKHSHIGNSCRSTCYWCIGDYNAQRALVIKKEMMDYYVGNGILSS